MFKSMMSWLCSIILVGLFTQSAMAINWCDKRENPQLPDDEILACRIAMTVVVPQRDAKPELWWGSKASLQRYVRCIHKKHCKDWGALRVTYIKNKIDVLCYQNLRSIRNETQRIQAINHCKQQTDKYVMMGLGEYSRQAWKKSKWRLRDKQIREIRKAWNESTAVRRDRATAWSTWNDTYLTEGMTGKSLQAMVLEKVAAQHSNPYVRGSNNNKRLVR